MERVRHYLDTIVWDVATGESGFDNDGNPTTPRPEMMTTSNVRYENFTSGNRREYIHKNGEVVLATGTLYIKYNQVLPKRFDIVSLVKVRGENRIVTNLEILNVDPNQLNSTIHTREYVGN